jgi:tetratricopeptide (TPR) repeat protein
MQGMPLGIELSAAWLRTLSADQIVEEIEGGLEFLSSSLRDVPERHRSISAVFDHSWKLLSEDEQSVFRKLSVFRGGFDREAAANVAGASLPVLSALVDKSLVKRNEAGRYEIHTLLQQYGRKHRIDAGEYESIRNRHRDWYLSLAEEVSGQKREHLWGTVDTELVERLVAEGDNLRIALRWSIDRGEADKGLRLAVALSWYWYVRAEFSEGRHWLEQTLKLKGGGSPDIRVQAMQTIAGLATSQRDHPRDVELGQEALQASYDGGYLRQAGWSLYQLGLAAMQQSDFEEAAGLCAQSFNTFAEIGYEAGMASLRVYQGIVAFYQGEYERAAELIEEGLPLLREVGDQIAVVRGLHGLGLVAHRQQDTELATSRLEEGLLLASEVSARLEVAQCLEGLAMVACAKGRFQSSSILLGFSEELRNVLGTPLSTAEVVDYERCLSEIQAGLSDDQFSDAWDQGQKMSQEDVAAYALGEDTPS